MHKRDSEAAERRARPGPQRTLRPGDLLTPKDVAQELGVSEAWIRDHSSGRRQPALPVVRLGAKKALLRFRRSDLEQFLALHTRNEATGEPTVARKKR
jgi:predicted DNA-binding transcriptional regulator AlpA